MERHTKTIVLVSIVALAYFAFRVGASAFETRTALALTVPSDIGMNEDLLAKVDTLEQEIARRASYEVELVRDPLNLGSAMNIRDRSAAAREFIEQHRRMRLSATIISPGKKSAVIKYRSKSYVVSVGDSLVDHRIERIDNKRVILSHKGREIELVNRPAPKAKRRDGSGADLEKIAL